MEMREERREEDLEEGLEEMAGLEAGVGRVVRRTSSEVIRPSRPPRDRMVSRMRRLLCRKTGGSPCRKKGKVPPGLTKSPSVGSSRALGWAWD